MDAVLILGTDTDAGKTAFAALWQHAFPGRRAYWKPLETGPSDTATLAAWAPAAAIHAPLARFETPVAPPLAARLAGARVPTPGELLAAVPAGPLLIESFGGPMSPLTDSDLQIAWLRLLPARSVLVSSSALGAVGRTLSVLAALAGHGVRPAAIALFGPPDPFAEEMLARHAPEVPCIAVAPPAEWNAAGFAAAAAAQAPAFARLAAALGETTPPVPPADDLLRADAAYVWHPYSPLRSAEPPLAVVGAEAEFLHLADGRRVIDGFSSWWTILHGHRHPALVQALRDASGAIDHAVFAGATHPWGVRLAERLLATAPWPGGRVFYSDCGSAAVEIALKLAWLHWQRRGERRTSFVGFEHGYHGDTFGAMAVGRDPVFFGAFEPLLFDAARLPLDPQRLDEHLAAHRGKIAAAIVEPLLQAAGGMRLHTPETLRGIAAACRRHDVLLIADEVATGNRLGTRWACAQAGVIPDLICAAKTITGGMMPLAATLVAPHLVAGFDDADRARAFFHGHSFTGHPLACAVALANCRLLDDPATLAAADRMGEFWRSALAPLTGRPGVAEVRIMGSMAAVEFAAEGGYLAELGPRLRQHALARGCFLRPLGNVLYAWPPLGTSPESLAQLAETVVSAAAECASA